jgi:hypothetical protein
MADRIAEPQVGKGIVKPKGASKCPRGCIERGENAVAGRLHEVAAEAIDLRTGYLVMAIYEPSPLLVANGGGVSGGSNDIGEQDRREDAIGVLGRLPRFSLLSGPGECFDAPAGRDSVGRLVCEDGDSPNRRFLSRQAVTESCGSRHGKDVSHYQARRETP